MRVIRNSFCPLNGLSMTNYCLSLTENSSQELICRTLLKRILSSTDARSRSSSPNQKCSPLVEVDSMRTRPMSIPVPVGFLHQKKIPKQMQGGQHCSF